MSFNIARLLKNASPPKNPNLNKKKQKKQKNCSLATIFFVWLSEELEINLEWSKKVT
jgi:hypothetical protein